MSYELVIPSYNRLEILRQTYLYVRKMYPHLPICLGLQGDNIENAFQTEELADDWLRIMKLTKLSPTYALNACVKSSDSDIILILDDDSVPCDNWLESYLELFKAEVNLLYASGREIRLMRGRSNRSELVRIILEAVYRMFSKLDKSLDGRVVGWISRSGLLFGNYTQSGTCLINTPRGCNMAFRRKAIDKFGGFNENLRGNFWGWESEWGVRLAKKGHLGKYLGSAIVIHSEAPTGGCRVSPNRKSFMDYLHNHRILIKQLGFQAWIGSIPRLLRFMVQMR